MEGNADLPAAPPQRENIIRRADSSTRARAARFVPLGLLPPPCASRKARVRRASKSITGAAACTMTAGGAVARCRCAPPTPGTVRPLATTRRVCPAAELAEPFIGGARLLTPPNDGGGEEPGDEATAGGVDDDARAANGGVAVTDGGDANDDDTGGGAEPVTTAGDEADTISRAISTRPDGRGDGGELACADGEKRARSFSQTSKSGRIDGTDRARFCANDRTVMASRPLSGCVKKHDAPRRRHRDAASADASVRPTMTMGTVASTARRAMIRASVQGSTPTTTTCTWAGTRDKASCDSSTAVGRQEVPTSAFSSSSASTP